MPGIKRFQGFKRLLLAGWLVVVALIAIGSLRSEGELSDKNTIKLLDYGLSKGYIRLVQRRAGETLQDVSPESGPTEDDLKRDQVTDVVYNDEQWQRVKRLVTQSVAIANWGLGDPFEYNRQGDMRYVKSFRAADFDYQNPYLLARMTPQKALISWSDEFNRSRHGWRVISRDLILFLRPDATKDEITVGPGGVSAQGVCLVAKRFLLKSSSGMGIRLSVGDAPFSKDEKNKATRLSIERVNEKGETVDLPILYEHGQSFLWNGKSFIAYNTLDAEPASSAPDTQEGRLQNVGLVFSKNINGRPSRIHLFGEATTGLLGTQLGSYITSFDGALNHNSVKKVELTLDPELQVASFFYLRDILDKLNSIHPIGRERRGSVTVLDASTGGILAQTGYPGVNSDMTARRRVLVERDEATRSPADEGHMTGSTIKVLTVSMGYLLAGNSQSGMLPRSINLLAIKQAYQNAYGVELNAPLEGNKALVSDAASAEFREEGTPQRVTPEFNDVLRNVYQVMPDVPVESQNGVDPATREAIIGSDFLQLFDERRLLTGFYPQRSRFPVMKADSMQRFRQLALGGWECKFTTMRLAAVLGTAYTGMVFKPFIVTSAMTSAGQQIKPSLTGLSEINVSVRDLEHRREKMKEITTDLRKVLVPDGTGFFFEDKGEKIYLAGDNPKTTENEADWRKDDFGKSGTADYDQPDLFNDSLFVYRHGRYLIAVWLEQADAGDQVDAEHRPFEQHTAHRFVDRLVSLIDSLEERK